MLASILSFHTTAFSTPFDCEFLPGSESGRPSPGKYQCEEPVRTFNDVWSVDVSGWTPTIGSSTLEANLAYVNNQLDAWRFRGEPITGPTTELSYWFDKSTGSSKCWRNGHTGQHMCLGETIRLACPDGFGTWRPSGRFTTPVTPSPTAGYPCYRPRIVEIDLSDPPSPPGTCAGNPIYPLTGVKQETLRTGISVGGQEVLFTYSSGPMTASEGAPRQGPRGGAFGKLWTSNLHRKLHSNIVGGTIKSASLDRGNGSNLTFDDFDAAGRSAARGTSPFIAQKTSQGWTVYDSNLHSVEQYDESGALLAVVYANGNSLTFQYSTSSTNSSIAPTAGYLIGVSDGRGRAISFSYAALPSGDFAVREMSTTSGVTKFSYSPASNLYRITWENSVFREFLYEQSDFPWALTGIVDENGKRYASFGYDSVGRAISTEHAGGVDRYETSYSSPPSIESIDSYDSVANVTYRRFYRKNPSGTTLTMPTSAPSAWQSERSSAGTLLVTGQSQPAGSGCAAAQKSVSYDAAGFPVTVDDFNGNRTCSRYNNGLEVRRISGLSTAISCSSISSNIPSGSVRTSRIGIGDVPWIGLVSEVAEPRRITRFIYHGGYDSDTGNIRLCAPADATYPGGQSLVRLCKKVERSTLDANGASAFAAMPDDATPPRVWTWTYNKDGQVLSEDGPRTDLNDVTTYEYYADTTADHAKGDLKKVTNALGRSILYTKYNSQGQLLESQDPNGVLTVNTYDPRQRLLSTTVGGQKTSYQYDPVGQLTRTTLPDGSYVGNDYDDAHRLVAVYDHLGNRTTYELDNAGNRWSEKTTDPTNQLKRQLGRSIDALGRVQQTTGRE